MTKGEFLKWLSQFKYVNNIRDMVNNHKFTDEELDYVAKHLVAKRRALKARRHGA